LPSEIQQETESAVDRLRVLEGLSNVGLEENNIRALPVALVVLAAHGSGEVILREQIIVFRFLTHTESIPGSA
jgi:hypothetical protein